MFGDKKMKKIVIAVIGIAIIGVTGCSVSPSGDETAEAVAADDSVALDSDLWGSGEEDIAAEDDGEVAVEEGEEGGSGEEADDESDDPDASAECEGNEHTIEGVIPTDVKVGDNPNITLTVVGGSGNFLWEDSSSALPEGLAFAAEGDSASITGTVSEAAGPGEYTINVKVTDLGCDRSVIESLTLTVIEGITADFSYKPTLGIVVDDEAEEEVEPRVEQIKVRLDTGDMDGAGTNANVSIKFCTNNKYNNCHEFVLDEPDRDNERERNTNHWYRIAQGGPWDRSELRYFQLIFDKKGEKAPWQLEGIKVEFFLTNHKKELVYYNPCVNKWLKKDGATLKFGPKDQAVCTITRTGWVDDAETNDSAHLIFPDYERTAVGDGSKNSSQNDEPHFTHWSEDLTLAMHLDWGNYNDRESNDKTSYGDWSFDKVFFEHTNSVPGTVGIVKGSTADGWYLKEFTFYIWKPAVDIKYADDCRDNKICHIQVANPFYYVKASPEIWLDDDDDVLDIYWDTNTVSDWTDNVKRGDFTEMGKYR